MKINNGKELSYEEKLLLGTGSPGDLATTTDANDEK